MNFLANLILNSVLVLGIQWWPETEIVPLAKELIAWSSNPIVVVIPQYMCLHRTCINSMRVLLLLLLSRFSPVQLCATPETAAHQAPPSPGFSRQEHWSGLPFPSPMHESEKWKWSHSVVSNSSWPHGLQPTRLLSWDFPWMHVYVYKYEAFARKRCLSWDLKFKQELTSWREMYDKHSSSGYNTHKVLWENTVHLGSWKKSIMAGKQKSGGEWLVLLRILF